MTGFRVIHSCFHTVLQNMTKHPVPFDVITHSLIWCRVNNENWRHCSTFPLVISLQLAQIQKKIHWLFREIMTNFCRSVAENWNPKLITSTWCFRAIDWSAFAHRTNPFFQTTGIADPLQINLQIGLVSLYSLKLCLKFLSTLTLENVEVIG